MNAPRRLLVICHGYPPYFGGAEHVAFYLAREAARGGQQEVWVLTSDIGGRLPAEENSEGVHILRMPAKKKRWERHSVVELMDFYRSVRRRAAAIATQVRPDAILVHFSFPAGEIARRMAIDLGIPYYVVLHGSDVPGYQPRRFGLLYPVVKPLIRRVWKQARRVIAVSEELRTLALETWPAGAIDVIRNGVDTDRFTPRSDPGSAPDRERPVRIVVVSQLIPRKGIQYLLEALSQLSVGNERLCVDVYGIGPYETVLRRRIAELSLGNTVRLRGLIAHNELPGVLGMADVFVLASLQEGLPLSLLEAMSAGLAVVATSVGGIPGVIRTGRNGLLVPPADSNALARAMTEVVSNPLLRNPLRLAARETALRYSWRAVWTVYEALMAE